jgi:hypothetical protein
MPATKAASAKPAKPTIEFPLWHHPEGGWAKKIRGKVHYFGFDAQAALAKYTAVKDDLEAGREPRAAQANGITVGRLVNLFLDRKQTRVAEGELTPGMFGEYYGACQRVVTVFGGGRAVSDLRPADFDRLRAAAADRLGPASLGKFVRMVKTLFAWGYKTARLDVPVRTGEDFRQPPKRTLRRVRRAKGERIVEAADARKLIEAADGPLKAMILLGLNAGFGATDCSALDRSALSRPGWLKDTRPKTEEPRRAKLWPETIAALAAVAKTRPEPADPADRDAVFVKACDLRPGACDSMLELRNGSGGSGRVEGVDSRSGKHRGRGRGYHGRSRSSEALASRVRRASGVPFASSVNSFLASADPILSKTATART